LAIYACTSRVADKHLYLANRFCSLIKKKDQPPEKAEKEKHEVNFVIKISIL
jgi:hypothetical protein